MTKPLFETVALIGIGLIGSSLARVIRAKGLAGDVAIATRSAETLEEARALGLGDSYFSSNAEAVAKADLVIVSVPVGASEAVAREIGPYLKPGAIVTDVGSTKASVVRQMQPHIPDTAHFVPGHPIAGTEQSGPRAGFAELFEGRWCILTPRRAPMPEQSHGWQSSGKHAARRSRRWIPIIMTWFWRSCRTFRISLPTISSGPRTIWKP
jgi:cyclohexadieny/prephenate dehydrogenase